MESDWGIPTLLNLYIMGLDCILPLPLRSVSANTGQAIDATIAVLASHVEHADTLPIISPQTLRCHNGALTVYFRHGELSLSGAICPNF